MLVPAGSDNPRGFFERPTVVDLNDRLLEAQGWAWDSLPAVALPAKAHWDPFVLEARNLVADFPEASLQGLKDPRFCITLSFWRRVLLDRFVVIRVSRDPAEVVWSLMVRNGYLATHAAALVKTYDRQLDRDLDGLLTLNVRFEELVADPKRVMETIHAALLGLGTDLKPMSATQLDKIREFINPQLRRDSVPHHIEKSAEVRSCRSAREAVLDYTDVFKPHIGLPKEPDVWEQDVLLQHMEMRTIMRNLAAAEDHNSELRNVTAENHVRIGRLSTELEELKNQSAVLKSQLAEVKQEALEDSKRSKATADDLTLRLIRRRSEIRELREDLEVIRASSIWRVGLLVTWPGRHLKRLLGRLIALR
jgi:hypothetical protein